MSSNNIMQTIRKNLRNISKGIINPRSQANIIDRFTEQMYDVEQLIHETKEKINKYGTITKPIPVNSKKLYTTILGNLKLSDKQQKLYDEAIFPNILKLYSDNYKLKRDYYLAEQQRHENKLKEVAEFEKKHKDLDPFLQFLGSVKYEYDQKNGHTKRHIEIEKKGLSKKQEKQFEDTANLTSPEDRKRYGINGVYTGAVGVVFTFWISDGKETRTFVINVVDKKDVQIYGLIKQYIADHYINNLGIYDALEDDFGIKYKLIGIGPEYKKAPLTQAEAIKKLRNPDSLNKNWSNYAFVDDEIKDVSFVKLPRNIRANESIIHVNCVWDLFKNIDRSIVSKKKYRQYLKDNNIIGVTIWTTAMIMNMLDDLKVNHIIYTRFGSVMKKQIYDDQRNIFYCIITNNHIYGLERSELKMFLEYTKIDSDITIMNIEQLTQPLDYYTNNHQVKYIKFGTDVVKENNKVVDIKLVPKTITVTNKLNSEEGTIFMNAKLYEATQFYLKIDPKMIITSKFSALKPLLHIAERHGLFSSCTDGWNTPKPINISNKYTGPIDNIYSLDVNTAYTTELIKLEYIPVIDQLSECGKYIDQDIIDTHLYWVSKVEPILSTILSTGICSGYRLNGLPKKYKISHWFKPHLIENPYSDFVSKMLQTNKIITKETVNIFIGMVQRYLNEGTPSFIFKDIIINENELEFCNENDKVVFIDNVHVVYNECVSKKKHIKTNMLPLAHYIVDRITRKIRTEIKLLSEQNLIDQIISVRTDCIMYKGRKPNKPLGPTIFGGFKIIDNKISENIIYRPFDALKEFALQKFDKNEFALDQDYLLDCIAGSGKTTYFLKNVIPTLQETNKKFFVACAQWSPIVGAYKNFDITSMSRLMKLGKVNGLPFYAYEYILIEEVGLLSSYMSRWLYDNVGRDQRLIVAGDRKQLIPVKDPLKSVPLDSILIQHIFGSKICLKQNYRNRYDPKTDYKNMRNGTFVETTYELDFTKKIDEHCWNIVYHNETKDKFNKHISRNWTDKIGNLPIKINARVICKTNKMKHRKIYNKQIFNVVSYDDKEIVLKLFEEESNDEDLYSIIPDEYEEHFNLAYALTLYCVQGRSIPHAVIRFHEIEFIKQHIENGIYVAYSRIKDIPPKIQKTKKITNELTINW